MTGRVSTPALILGLLLIGVTSTRAAVPTPNAFSHLRPLDDRAKFLLKEGLDASFTVQQLARHLEQSDVVVYLRVAILNPDLAGTTTLQAVTAETRYVVVTVDPHAIPLDLVSRLGHELRHAVEIADAPEVRSVDAMRQLFKRIGWRSGGTDRWETKEALATGRDVMREYWERPLRLGDLARAGTPEKPAAR